jgi:hypothetical protein
VTAISTHGQVGTATISCSVEERAPQFGRCVKVPSEKVGTKTVYHGGFTAATCLVKSGTHTGPYEWYSGVVKGAFKTAIKPTTKATFETVKKVKVTCSGETSTGAVTSAKTFGSVLEGHGAIVIDPKGDRMLREELEASAERRGARFLEWTPEGPLAYNPYAQGTDTEIADKALSGEQFTEPHYLRQAQRYLGHAVRVMHDAGIPVTPVSLMRQLDPGGVGVRRTTAA